MKKSRALKSLHKNLQQALATWPQWPVANAMPPIVEASLTGGLNNRSYKIRCGSQPLVVRLNHPNSQSLGVDRALEKTILEKLAGLNIAPRHYFSASDFSFSVLEFIDGRVWTEADIKGATQRQMLFALMRQYQSLDIVLPRFSYSDYLWRYWQRCQRANLSVAKKDSARWIKFAKRLRLYEKTRSCWTLTHHDLNPKNIIESRQGLRIIDWEYAGLGFAELDAAMLASFAGRGKTTGSTGVLLPTIVEELYYWLDYLWWQVR